MLIFTIVQNNPKISLACKVLFLDYAHTSVSVQLKIGYIPYRACFILEGGAHAWDLAGFLAGKKGSIKKPLNGFKVLEA